MASQAQGAMDETILNQNNEECGAAIKIERETLNQHQFDDKFCLFKPVHEKDCWDRIKDRASQPCSLWRTELIYFLISLFPITSWLPKYSWRKDLISDVISGFTVTVMHISQGMGYALLGSVKPVVGLYMAFFPVLVYVFLGTSHHISLGTFAVTTLMTGRIVDQFGTAALDTNMNSTGVLSNETSDRNLEVATAVCLMVGIWQIVMGICRLGVISIILSDHLVSGFTTGAAVHVLTSQIKNLLGIHVPRFNGSFRLIKTYGAIFTALPSANYVEVLISAIAITVMAVHNDYFKPWLRKRVNFSIPAELLILVLGTVISYYSKLKERCNVQVLDHIPTGLPPPQVPPHDILAGVAFDSITIAIVAYTVSLSMAKIFARKRGYEVDSNQELMAHGLSNVTGSFFLCMPVAASLSRSLLQESVGGQTQVASVVSCFLLLFVLLWLGPLFEPLPLSLLASIIVVALKGMLLQSKDFAKAMKTSPLDASVWMLTFLTVVIFDIDIGLGVGILTSIVLLIYRSHQPHSAVLGHLPGTELYVDISLYPTAIETVGMKIFRWSGAIHFANWEAFRRVVDEYLRPIPSSLSTSSSSPTEAEVVASSPSHVGSLKDLKWEGTHEDQKTLNCGYLGHPNYAFHETQPGELPPNAQHDASPCCNHVSPIKYLICDCSAIAFVDLAGCQVLMNLNRDLQVQHQIHLVLAACSSPLIDQLERNNFFRDFPKDRLFPSVLDAVMTIEAAKNSISVHDRASMVTSINRNQCALNL